MAKAFLGLVGHDHHHDHRRDGQENKNDVPLEHCDVSPQIGFADAHVTLGQKKGYDFHQEIDHDFAYLSIRRSD